MSASVGFPFIGQPSSASRTLLEASTRRLFPAWRLTRCPARLRREIQYAVEAVWPAKKKTNAAICVEFKLSPDRALA